MSSSVMVALATGFSSMALVGEDRVTRKVSSPSTTVSCVIRRSRCATLWPADMVAVCAVVTAS